MITMTDVLLQHIEDTKKTSRSGQEQQERVSAVPPTTARPSLGKTGTRRTTVMRVKEELPEDLFGRKYFCRDVSEREMTMLSRFGETLPEDKNYMTKALDLNEGSKTHDEVWNDHRRIQVKSKLGSFIAMESGIRQEHVDQKLYKQRNLAEHLINYSVTCTSEESPLEAGSVGTFFSVADSLDMQCASMGMIALSNISSLAYVRDMMKEMNCLHKFTNISKYIGGATAMYAASVLFFYLSCSNELEDRLFSVSSNFLNTAGESGAKQVRDLSIHTLQNLLPCLERLKVSEMLCRLLNNHLNAYVETKRGPEADMPDMEFAEDMISTFLPSIRANVSFNNTHNTIINNDVMDVVLAGAMYAQKFGNVEMAKLVAEILICLVATQNSPAVHTMCADASFNMTLEHLSDVRDEFVLKYVVRTIAIVSGISELVNYAADSEVVAIISNIILKWDEFDNDLAEDLAKYLSNICYPSTKEAMRSLVNEDDLQVAIMQLMHKIKVFPSATKHLCTALQNLLIHPDNSRDLCGTVLPTLMECMDKNHDLAAARAVFNISCVATCVAPLMESRVHILMQSLFTKNADIEARNVYLSTMLQLMRVDQCIKELYNNGILDALHASITNSETEALWPNAINIMLYLVHCNEVDFVESEMQKVISLLNIVCNEDTSEEIVGQAAVVIAYLSLSLEEVSTVAHLLKRLLDLSDKVVVEESVSVTLYNFSCSRKGIDLLISEKIYINMMVRLMRNGSLDVKQNVAKTLRTLCTEEKALELIMEVPPPPPIDPFARTNTPAERPNAPLADFIVIALLRASSDSAKIMCTQAFFNMLMHDKTRNELLGGELWWAITRLAKTDDEQILEAASRALLDLTTVKETCLALREQHVVTFIQEVIRGHSEAFMSTCMRAVKNFLVNVPAPFNLHELTSLIIIALVVIEQSKEISTLEIAHGILLTVALQNHGEGLVHGFVDNHTVEILHNSREVWGADPTCCKYTAQLLWQLSLHSYWNNNTPLHPTSHQAGICDILSTCYKAGRSIECGIDIMATLLNYIKEALFAPDELADLAFARDCIYDSFEVTPFAGDIRDQHVFAVALFSFLLEAWCDMDGKVTLELVKAYVRQDFYEGKETKTNISRIILNLTQRRRYADMLLEAELFTILYKNLQKQTMLKDDLLQYCSTCVRNLSLQEDLVPRLLSTTTHLDDLVALLVDSNPTEGVLLDIISLFYNASKYKFQNDFIINSRFSLDTIDRIGRITSSNDTQSVGKYVIAEILEKYSKGVNVDPAFVQSMFVEITEGNSSKVAAFMDGVLFKSITIDLANTDVALFSAKKGHDAEWEYAEENETMWKPYLFRERIHMETQMLDNSPGQVIAFAEFVPSDPLPVPSYEKIIRDYPRIGLPPEGEWDHVDNLQEDGVGEEKTASSTSGSSP